MKHSDSSLPRVYISCVTSRTQPLILKSILEVSPPQSITRIPRGDIKKLEWYINAEQLFSSRKVYVFVRLIGLLRFAENARALLLTLNLGRPIICYYRIFRLCIYFQCRLPYQSVLLKLSSCDCCLCGLILKGIEVSSGAKLFCKGCYEVYCLSYSRRPTYEYFATGIYSDCSVPQSPACISLAWHVIVNVGIQDIYKSHTFRPPFKCAMANNSRRGIGIYALTLIGQFPRMVRFFNLQLQKAVMVSRSERKSIIPTEDMYSFRATMYGVAKVFAVCSVSTQLRAHRYALWFCWLLFRAQAVNYGSFYKELYIINIRSLNGEIHSH